MIDLRAVRHAFPEDCGFTIDRPRGYPAYTLLHFFTPVEIIDGEKLIKTESHACIIYEPGVRQYFKSEGALIHDWMHFDFKDSAKLSLPGIEPNRVFYPKRYEFITETVRELESEFYSELLGREELIRAKLGELFIKLCRSVSERERPPLKTRTEAMLRALREENFRSLRKNPTVPEMARKAGLSQSRFYTLYKALFGISPTDDMIKARMAEAENALLTTDGKIETVAHSLGYQNVTHFIRQFKSFFGESPGEYRKRSVKSSKDIEI